MFHMHNAMYYWFMYKHLLITSSRLWIDPLAYILRRLMSFVFFISSVYMPFHMIMMKSNCHSSLHF